jgi:UDP-N-acetylglucosamine 3-dehydrogenase
VIGLGSVGRAHAAAYRADARAELAGVCDTDAARAEDAGRRLRTASFGNAQKMLAEARPHLVSVCVGSADQTALVAQALDAGCHVLCGIPLATDLAQTKELVARAREQGLCVAADFNLRFTPAAVRAREWIDEVRLGTPLFINAALWSRCDGAEDQAAFLRRLACHAFDLMRLLCGEIAEVQCFAAEPATGSSASPGGRASSAQVNMRFANGVVGGLTVSADMVTQHPMARCEVAGTVARVLIDNIYEEITLYPHAEEEKTVITNSIFGGLGGYEDTFGCRIGRLLEQLTAGAAPDAIDGSGADALAAQAAVEAAVRSLKSGEVVVVPDVRAR